MKRKGIAWILALLLCLAYVGCAADGRVSSEANSDDRMLSANDAEKFNGAAIASDELVCHILGETAITTPDIMSKLDEKLSEQDAQYINEWKDCLVRHPKELISDEVERLYDKAVSIYGDYAMADMGLVAAMPHEIDSPHDKEVVQSWVQNGSWMTHR